MYVVSLIPARTLKSIPEFSLGRSLPFLYIFIVDIFIPTSNVTEFLMMSVLISSPLLTLSCLMPYRFLFLVIKSYIVVSHSVVSISRAAVSPLLLTLFLLIYLHIREWGKMSTGEMKQQKEI